MNTKNASRPDEPQHMELHAELFLNLIPDLPERAAAFCVPSEFVDDAVREAFKRQMALTREALRTALASADEAAIRRQAHSLQGMGGAAGSPEISVVGEELSLSAQAGNFARCAALASRLEEWSVAHAAPSGSSTVTKALNQSP